MIKEFTIKRFAFLGLLLLLAVSLLSCGGGSGSLSGIGGENPGVPSVMELAPSSYIAQTNAFITLNTKVLDGNGKPVPNTTVIYTNLSHPIGVLSSTTAVTDSSGIARVNLSSTTPGFATILAQVYTGAGQVRDRKTVFFTTRDVLRVTMDMDVNSVPGNTIYNELSDFTLFENSEDDTVEVLVTVRNAGGVPVAGESVQWFRSHSEATWVRTETSTNVFGQAKAVIKVEPSSIRNTETHLNIMAFAGNGAANMVTLFLRPVVPDPATSYLTADPTVVDVNGTSTITAVVMLNTGSRAPDGTTVNFKVICDTTFPGLVIPFAQTTAGVAQATFTAPPVPGECTVTGRAAGVTIGSVKIKVKAPLTIMPSAQTVTGGATATFTIHGGLAPYTVTSSHPSVASPSLSGTTITVTTATVTAAATVTITVRDVLGATASATLTINPAGGGGGGGTALTITPSSATVNAGLPVSFVITGGTASYTVSSSHPSVAYDTAPGDGSWTVAANGGSFVVNTLAGLTTATTVTLTVLDSASPKNIVTATLTINPAGGGGGGFALTPKSITLTGLPEPNTADDIVFRITGGTAPYTMFSNNNAVIPSQGAVGAAFTADPAPVTADTKVIITVVDSTGATVTSEVTVTPVSPAIAVNPSVIFMTTGDSAVFYILGGTGGPLTITSGSSNVTLTGCSSTNVTTLNCPAGTTQFTVNAVNVVIDNKITVIDINGGTFAVSTVNVSP